MGSLWIPTYARAETLEQKVAPSAHSYCPTIFIKDPRRWEENIIFSVESVSL